MASCKWLNEIVAGDAVEHRISPTLTTRFRLRIAIRASCWGRCTCVNSLDRKIPSLSLQVTAASVSICSKGGIGYSETSVEDISQMFITFRQSGHVLHDLQLAVMHGSGPSRPAPNGTATFVTNSTYEFFFSPERVLTRRPSVRNCVLTRICHPV